MSPTGGTGGTGDPVANAATSAVACEQDIAAKREEMCKIIASVSDNTDLLRDPEWMIMILTDYYVRLKPYSDIWTAGYADPSGPQKYILRFRRRLTNVCRMSVD